MSAQQKAHEDRAARVVDPVPEPHRLMRYTGAAGISGLLAVLSDDYFTCPEDRIPSIQSVLTVVGGKVVYEAE